MKEIIKTILIGFLLLTTLVFGCKYYSCRPNYVMLPHTPQLDSIVAFVPPTTTYHDTQGVQHTVINSAVNTIIEGEKTEQAKKIEPIITKLAEDLMISAKNINSSTTISTITSATEVEFLKREIDSLKRITYFYRDKYLTLAVHPVSLDDTIDEPTFDFSYNADLNITQYTKRKWFLGTKESFTDISSTDPRTSIKGVRTFTVKQKEPTFGLRIQAVAGYNMASANFFAGPSLRFDIKNMSFRALYSYNNYTKRWSPTIAGEYNLIKF